MSKQDGKQESQIEIDVLTNSIRLTITTATTTRTIIIIINYYYCCYNKRELEDQLRAQSTDNRKLRFIDIVVIIIVFISCFIIV